MTVYSRNDLAAVNLSVEGHGGCGEPHSRPVVNGAPKKIWDLTCPQCENHLRHDPLWSVNPIEIPETYDETKARERSEKAGKMDRERQLAVALEQLAPLGQLPAALGQMLAALAGGTVTPALAGTMECPSGHANAAGLKFCGECGTPMSQPVAAAAISAPPEEAAKPPASSGPLPRLRDQPKPVLRAMAAERDLDGSGTNGDLISRLSKAGVTNRDVAEYLNRQPVAA